MWLLSHDIKVCDSDLLEGMTNWHCHLLPGVDDGVSAVCETNKILKLWETMGMKEVWLTPHIMEEIPNKTAYLKNQYKQLQEQVKDSRIRLHLAAENMLDNEFQHRLAKEDLLTLGSQNQVLVETSYYNPPMGMKRILNDIIDHGYTPVLAHPERYMYMEMKDYREIKAMGVLLQLNIPSLFGFYGQEAKTKAKHLLNCEMYNLTGTDTHSFRPAEHILNRKISPKMIRKIKSITA
jgi:tyrosine-protein phosphatase YwqE